MSTIATNLYTFKNFTHLTESESDEVLQGRNDAQVRRWMTSDRKINAQEHRNFLASLKTCCSQFYFRVERRGHFVGVYSLTDIRDQSAVGGFWIAAEARKKLLGLSIVYNSINYVFNNCLIGKIRGYQLTDNRPVVKLNTMLGFVQIAPSLHIDPRMSYLELTRADWENHVLNSRKIIKMIEITDSNRVCDPPNTAASKCNG